MFKKNILSLIFISSIFISACSQETDQANQIFPSDKKEIKAIAPEENPELKGTQVLGFKMRDSTVSSVKNRLENYKVSGDESYAKGAIIENDGSGFNIDGLEYTQFGFDKNQKLVYVWMTIKENNHMSHETYKKIVGYVQKNNYKIIEELAPFVGDRKTVFQTPNKETISVSKPHLGGFKINVEYATNEFIQQRNLINQENEQTKQQSESANF